MKKIFISILALLTFSATFAQTEKFSLKVNGLSCAYCAYGLEKKFTDVNGIQDIHINLEEGMMDFTVPATTALTADDVKSRVVKAGYTPVHLRVERGGGAVEEVTMSEATEASAGAACDAKMAQKVAKESFKVKGSCGMCETRIEAAAKSVNGVVSADWNTATQILKVKFRPNDTPLQAIHDAVAKAGHDTDLARADDATYKELPGCCMYERK